MSTAPDADLPAQRLARLLLSGTVGQALFGQLCEEFLSIARWDAFFGFTLAATEYQAALVACDAETHHLRRRLAEAEAELAALKGDLQRRAA